MNTEEKIILDNQNLIYSIIHKYFNNYPNKNDLFQEGCLGLIKASRKYDSSFDTKFSSFAYKYILGEMSNHVREDKGIKISHDLQKLYYKVEKVRLLLYQKYMREPNIVELSNYLELPQEKIVEILNIPTNIQSLDDKVKLEDNDLDLYEIIPDKDKDIDELLTLKGELSKLDENERELIKARYEENMTQSEAADLLGMSQVQVSRYEKKVLVKLKSRLQV